MLGRRNWGRACGRSGRLRHRGEGRRPHRQPEVREDPLDDGLPKDGNDDVEPPASRRSWPTDSRMRVLHPSTSPPHRRPSTCNFNDCPGAARSNSRLTGLSLYAKAPVMRSSTFTSASITSYARRSTRSCPSHNHSVFRNARSESVALNRLGAVLGSCSFASAFSFIARSACVYW